MSQILSQNSRDDVRLQYGGNSYGKDCGSSVGVCADEQKMAHNTSQTASCISTSLVNSPTHITEVYIKSNHNSSCIPLPVRNPPVYVTEIYAKHAETQNLSSAFQGPMISCCKKNSRSSSTERKDNLLPSQAQKDKSFEAFVMTGDMILDTNSTVTKKSLRQDVESFFPQLGHSKNNEPHLHQSDVLSLDLDSHISRPLIYSRDQHHHQHSSPHHQNHLSDHQDYYRFLESEGEMGDFPLIHAPVAEMEELSDLSESSCSESELELENGSTSKPQCLPAKPDNAQMPTVADAFKLEETTDYSMGKLPGNNTSGTSDMSFSEPPSSGDSGFIYDGHASDSDLADRGLITDDNLTKGESYVSDETLTEKRVTSDHTKVRPQSDNTYQANSASYFSDGVTSDHIKIRPQSDTTYSYQANGDICVSDRVTSLASNTDRMLVRTSKSHENYLQASTGIALVNIDIDDSLAYSLDTLTYHDSPDSCKDVLSEHLQLSKSLDNSPEKGCEKFSGLERDFIPGYVSFEDPKSVRLRSSMATKDAETGRSNESNDMKNFNAESTVPSQPLFKFGSENQNNNGMGCENNCSGQMFDGSDDDILQPCSQYDDLDNDNLYHQPCKAVDRPSAERLAKRLFNLEGFRKSDVSRHLCKKNDFSSLVAEEYLKFYDFQEDTLDMALRKFLLRFSLSGETQERERVLAHFSHRFMECNPESFNSEDACHTLTCAIMLLNSDLHSKNIGRKMACQDFIDNLTELNDGEDFSKEVLKAIYQSIKNEPIQWAVDEAAPNQNNAHLPDQAGQLPISIPQVLGGNPFLEVPDSEKTTEYKKGYVMRKCCMDSNRRKTPLGKRGWKMLYAVLQDMILYQYKDEHQLKKGHFVGSTHSAIRIHHALATKATDYTKKQHVFRLQTADWAEYLFQTGDSKELQEWVDTINVVAATLSAPVLPGAVGSKAKFQRQLMPSSYTRLNLREQLHSHESRVADLEQELHTHHAAAPEKGTRSSVIQEYLDKENYLEFETKRFRTYVYLLQSKLLSSSGLEPSLVETTIGEYEEMKSVPPYSFPAHFGITTNTAKPSSSAASQLQRSMSDRYSYRAAIYQSDRMEYDIV